jgi:short-subunit dehydrogenase involved in D-alanine esterification of teichoic acids
MVEEVKRYRAEMNAMIQDLKDKQDRMQILNEEQAKLNKNINRCVCCAELWSVRDVMKLTGDSTVAECHVSL